VPARKGCIPEAPDGGHSIHAGTLLDGAVVALPEDPPELGREDDVVLDGLPEAPPEPPPVDGAPPADPVAEPPVVVLGVARVAAVGVTEVVGETANADVPVPSVTMPLGVTLPGVAAVCANAGKATAIQISVAKRTVPIMGATQPVSCPAGQPPRASTFGGVVSWKPKRRPRSRWSTKAQVTAAL
jgi:hypothetical protein